MRCAVLLLFPILASASTFNEEGLPPLDYNIEECRALIAERKGKNYKPSKHELYRVGDAAGLLCDTFTDAEWEQIYGDSDHG